MMDAHKVSKENHGVHEIKIIGSSTDPHYSDVEKSGGERERERASFTEG